MEIKSDRRRELWDTVIKAVQRSLPSDPEAPSLLAMTRPIRCEAESTLHAAAPLSRTKDPNITSRGSCYECGKVTLTTLVDLVLKGRDEDAGDDAADTEVVAPASGDTVDDQEFRFTLRPMAKEMTDGSREEGHVRYARR